MLRSIPKAGEAKNDLANDFVVVGVSCGTIN